MPHFSSSQSKFLIRVSLKNTLSLIGERPRTTLKINSLNRALAQSCCDHTHTFIQPVSESIEDDSLHPRGGDPQRVTPHIRLVVDVILKYVDLKKERRWWGDWFYYSCSSRLFFCSFFYFCCQTASDLFFLLISSLMRFCCFILKPRVYRRSGAVCLLSFFHQCFNICIWSVRHILHVHQYPESPLIHFSPAWRAFLLFLQLFIISSVLNIH